MVLLNLHSLNWIVFFPVPASSARFSTLLALSTARCDRDFSHPVLAAPFLPQSSRCGKKSYWSRFSFSV